MAAWRTGDRSPKVLIPGWVFPQEIPDLVERPFPTSAANLHYSLTIASFLVSRYALLGRGAYQSYTKAT